MKRGEVVKWIMNYMKSIQYFKWRNLPIVQYNFCNHIKRINY